MRAIVCEAHGPIEQLRVKEIPDAECRDKTVVIRTRAAGVSFVDTLLVQGTYQVKVPAPFVVGGEVAGDVMAVGEHVHGLSPGDAVVAMTGVGAFAEQVATSASRIVPMPAGLDYAQAAAFPMVCATAQYALMHRGRLQPDETVLILGAAGGTGMAALQLAKAHGARVIAAASTAGKLQACREQGADEVINYSEQDLKTEVKALTGGKGADLVFDPVGGDLSEQALRATGWGGRFLVIGFAAGTIPKVALNLPLIKGCAVVGVDWGALLRNEPAAAQAVLAEVAALYKRGKLAPLPVQRYPFEEASRALSDLAERKVRGKAVLQF